MCALLKVPHPDVLNHVLTYNQFVEWSQFYAVQPWTAERDDLRFEVFRLRLLIGLLGDGQQKMPDYQYPHATPDDEDPVEIVQRLRQKWAELEREKSKNGNQRNSSTP